MTDRPFANALAIAALLLAPTLAPTVALAQAPPNPGPQPITRDQRLTLEQTAPLTVFPLKYATEDNAANEILTGLRLMLDPSVKIYLVSSDHTILLRGLPDDVALARTVIDDLDRPRETYRATFTLAEYDGPQKLRSADYTMTLLDGQRATLRQGSRLPVATGTLQGSSTTETQMTYLDVGLNIDATVFSNQTGAILKSKVEQSGMPDGAPIPTSATPANLDPTLHQTVMEGTTGLPLGHATPLGTLDSQGPNHRTEVTVKLEKLP